VFEQMAIPGSIVYIYPKTKAECSEQLTDVYRTMARATVPEEYIKAVFSLPRNRIAFKRLREKVISDGYQLMLHIEDALKSEKLLSNHLWQQRVIVFWNHYSLSINRMNDYIQEQRDTDEGERDGH
jgi:hypothetical protein